MDVLDPQHPLRTAMRRRSLQDEASVLDGLLCEAALSDEARAAMTRRAHRLVEDIRQQSTPGLMELFLDEYGLSTQEGVALMCLAEALLRVPDVETIDALIEDKIAPSKWAGHLGRSSSPLVNASTWALMLTGAVLRHEEQPGLAAVLRGTVKRLGEPVIRNAVAAAMRELGEQFVLGRTIGEAAERAETEMAKGYTYSYDMLGEAARTFADAKRYHLAYSEAISALSKTCKTDDTHTNPGISVKLSALHPRYESTHAAQLTTSLVPTVRSLALLAKSAGMGFNIDAEEGERLELSLDIAAAVLRDPGLAEWDGFGMVVQTYDKRAPLVLDWLYDLARQLDRKIMVRLVKGAYWDTQIKRAQVLGIAAYPVFTRKPTTDVCYIACAKKLLAMNDRIYPQFATHNAHTAAAVLELAAPGQAFEFQRLHGMGAALHDRLIGEAGVKSRIYAPVGSHGDLLAYLVRRLLENGANSSFVNQVVDATVPIEAVIADPFDLAAAYQDGVANPKIPLPPAIYGEARRNAAGWDVFEPRDRERMEAARQPFHTKTWTAGAKEGATPIPVINPADPNDTVGTAAAMTQDQLEAALAQARPWQATPEDRAAVLVHAAELYEANSGELFALLAREAGKTPLDAIGEVREAVDFLRYYAAELLRQDSRNPWGVFACISPWNFPLAIFTGQITAALAAGNGVLAKPAGQTPLIAQKAVRLLHDAGVPQDVLQLCPGDGVTVGHALVSDPRIHGVCFTGSTQTAQSIHRAMAEHLDPAAPLIAETGGLNAMIVDSTALPEQAVRDIVISAFQSAGQRCSALRILYVQEDIADDLLAMLYGAMEALTLGTPWDFATDVGPVIDDAARFHILDYIDAAEADGRLLKKVGIPPGGHFVPPCVISVEGIHRMAEEIFGPVLHVARFASQDFDRVIDAVNGAGYGLTFGLHTRIDDRVQHVIDRVHVGNLYVNRNQIGAIVGSQPFGGEGLSGTGPKAGGPNYLPRFFKPEMTVSQEAGGPVLSTAEIQAMIDALPPTPEEMKIVMSMPGPTGESNRLGLFPRGRVLCLGPTAEDLAAQVAVVEEAGCQAVRVASGTVEPKSLVDLNGFAAVVYWGGKEAARTLRQALAARSGPILPLIRHRDFAGLLYHERHVCIDTTATGGNAALLADAIG